MVDKSKGARHAKKTSRVRAAPPSTTPSYDELKTTGIGTGSEPGAGGTYFELLTLVKVKADPFVLGWVYGYRTEIQNGELATTAVLIRGTWGQDWFTFDELEKVVEEVAP